MSHVSSAPLMPSEFAIGWDQTWQNVAASRSVNTVYQNTTGRPIAVFTRYDSNVGGSFYVSQDGATWVGLGSYDDFDGKTVIVPVGHYYKLTIPAFYDWMELR